jgi:hypothetical protein
MTFRTFTVSLLSLFFGLIFPAYGSVSAIQSETGEDDTHWLIYWLIFSILTIVENVAWPVLQWIPLYSEVKVAILAWLVLPQTKGALWVYEAILAPGLKRARTEASKFPALENALKQLQGTTHTVKSRSAATNSMEISQRRSKLSALTKDIDSALSSRLERMAGISDPTALDAAEKAFDRELAKLARVANGSQKSV